jgi:hypothetical protein
MIKTSCGLMALLSSPNYVNTDREFTAEKQNTHTKWNILKRKYAELLFIYLFVYSFINDAVISDYAVLNDCRASD